MFYDEILKIGNFILDSFLHIWPYLLVTIPLAVAIQMSGASKYIKSAFGARPLIAIVLATVVGAFSPFCSCGVIPVIASLLISGVPLAPVMSFWIASPSMDPEIFFLSAGMIGWELAIWRLAATLLLSFGAGLVTHFVMGKGWLGQSILRTQKATPVPGTLELIRDGWLRLKSGFSRVLPAKHPSAQAMSTSETLMQLLPVLQPSTLANASVGAPVCKTCGSESGLAHIRKISPCEKSSTDSGAGCCNSRSVESTPCDPSVSFRSRLIKETLSATWMVGKFMLLAFLLEGLITFYVPGDWITAALGAENPLAIVTAALLGVPAYTTSLTALPMVGGLLAQGMNPAAALAFLVAGPTTTLPAMAAVWPLVSHRVFGLYVSFSLVGAVLAGYAYSLAASLR
jgi:uncharacterized membrane protein YraQ (UPF0718 family)